MLRKINMKFTLNKFLNAQYGVIDCKFSMVQLISRACSSYLTEILCQGILVSPFLSSCVNYISLSGSMNLTILDTACKWNDAVFVFVTDLFPLA